MRTAETLSCKRCGHLYKESTTSKLCCLYAPEPTGWCAWCGDGLKKLVFCCNACAKSYQEDAFMSHLVVKTPKRLVGHP